jgi:hypothetical protein
MVVPVLIAIACLACEEPTTDGCFDGTSFWTYSPRDTTVTVGSTVELSFTSGDRCSDGRVLSSKRSHRAWTTTDTLIVRVDTSAQQAIALEPGTAHITVPDDSWMVATIHVIDRTAMHR